MPSESEACASSPSASTQIARAARAEPVARARLPARGSVAGAITAISSPADAAEQVGLAAGGAQHVRDVHEDAVAGAVTAEVVDELEVVEVEDSSASGSSERRGARDLTGEVLVEGPVVEEAGQRVGARAAVARPQELIVDGDAHDAAARTPARAAPPRPSTRSTWAPLLDRQPGEQRARPAHPPPPPRTRPADGAVSTSQDRGSVGVGLGSRAAEMPRSTSDDPAIRPYASVGVIDPDRVRGDDPDERAGHQRARPGPSRPRRGSPGGTASTAGRDRARRRRCRRPASSCCPSALSDGLPHQHPEAGAPSRPSRSRRRAPAPGCRWRRSSRPEHERDPPSPAGRRGGRRRPRSSVSEPAPSASRTSNTNSPTTHDAVPAAKSPQIVRMRPRDLRPGEQQRRDREHDGRVVEDGQQVVREPPVREAASVSTIAARHRNENAPKSLEPQGRFPVVDDHHTCCFVTDYRRVDRSPPRAAADLSASGARPHRSPGPRTPARRTAPAGPRPPAGPSCAARDRCRARRTRAPGIVAAMRRPTFTGITGSRRPQMTSVGAVISPACARRSCSGEAKLPQSSLTARRPGSPRVVATPVSRARRSASVLERM